MSFESAVGVARKWMSLSYNAATWELLVVGPSTRLGGLCRELDLPLPADRRAEVAFHAARAIRLRHPALTDSPAAWRAKPWSRGELDEIVQIVRDEVLRVLASPVVQAPPWHAPFRHGRSTEPTVTGFTAWRPFVERRPVSDAEGVYIIALGADLSGVPADPLSDSVIYIGMAGPRGLRARTNEFERGALTCYSHPGGWHYRTEVYPDDWQRLSGFYETWIAWSETPGRARAVEAHLRREYRHRRGRLPRSNRV